MTVSTVRQLWRYPVKSMGGEEVCELELGPDGVVGDRAYGFFDVAAKRLVSAKKARLYGKLLGCRARLLSPAGANHPPAVEVTFPDGSVVSDDNAEVSRRATELLGRDVRLVASTDPAAQEFVAMAARATFADLAPVHVLTTGILNRMSAAYPGGAWDARRFRPNLFIDGADLETDDLLNCDLTVGPDVVLHAAMPTPRCVMTTLQQGDLPHDARILRAVAGVDFRKVPVLGDKPCAGVYTDVVNSGVVRRGDPVGVERVSTRHGTLAATLEVLEAQQG
jgi:uncharacterized protein